MDSARSGNVCRRFINGFCRFGSRCKFIHDSTPIPASQICRYFQKGECWYGERCRFFHVLPQVGPAFAGRRGSAPAASSSSMAYSSERRGSEPALQRANVSSRHQCSGSQSAVAFSPPLHTRHPPEYIVADRSQENDMASAQRSDIAQASAWQGTDEEPSISETAEDGATAASNNGNNGVTGAFLQSKNVVCGICMEAIYEKETERGRVFGILPNCNHPFCLECITTWRKVKDIGSDVVRACPQCRVRSDFYVPSKYWVEGQEKEKVIAAFKKKFSEKRCHNFDRYGYCPFKKECLYRHVPDSTPSALSYILDDLEEEEDDDDDDDDVVDLGGLLGIFISMRLIGGEDAEEDLLFYLTEDHRF
ncbi:makorin, ring finger protein, 4 [Fundulus heteroclitus]|uniref:makorin, ring finger protein, 4 n=1 Tax=Fundulus heteroclitus TaxID=8078 RepID=UPI00165B96D8|nr:makorin, ring finger protein, 4 [Fundulus heteroclitus]